MRLKVSGKTDIGLKRKMNQDSILIDSQNKLFIVADGMGGHKGGEVASKMACQKTREIIGRFLASEPDLSPEAMLEDAFQEATRSVYLEANKPSGEEDLKGMGTTMVVLFIYRGRAYFANVGDSRAYLYSENSFWRITEDHSLVNERLRAGVITDEDAQGTLGKNVITRSVGFVSEVSVDIFSRDLKVGEKYILCSDGLHGLVPDEKILEELQQNNTDQFVEEMVQEANRRGGDDNVSCLLIEIEA